MTETKLNPKFSFVITKTLKELAVEWFDRYFSNYNIGMHIDTINPHMENGYVRHEIKCKVEYTSPGGRPYYEYTHVADLRLYNANEMQLIVLPDFLYLFDDVEAIYKKMAES